jgi:hypothetical protein
MAFDRADWHYGGDFPKDLEPENGGTHIGFFLSWIILNDLVGELHRKESIDSLNKLKAREITGRDFLFAECDEKFTDEDVNEIGLNFTKFYYDDEKTAQYLNDLSKTFENYPSIYHVEDTWENYAKISTKIDDAFKKWKDKDKKKSWWKIF